VHQDALKCNSIKMLFVRERVDVVSVMSGTSHYINSFNNIGLLRDVVSSEYLSSWTENNTSLLSPCPH